MAIKIGTAASRLTANAATVATAMAGGTTTAEVQALGAVLKALSERPAIYHQLATLVANKNITEDR